jgi:hypothetical protein
MVRTGRPRAELVVTEQQSSELKQLARRSRTNRQVAFRAKIVLASGERCANVVSRKLRDLARHRVQVAPAVIEDGVHGLFDEPPLTQDLGRERRSYRHTDP